MDLLDLMDGAEPQAVPIRGGDERTPTLCVDPQKAQLLEAALKARDWRRANHLGAVWYDQHAGKWFKFTSHFWDHVDYWM